MVFNRFGHREPIVDEVEGDEEEDGEDYIDLYALTDDDRLNS